MNSVLLGLGANTGDRAANLDAAVAGLSRFLNVTARSPVYETAPMYVEDQAPFLNMALTAETPLAPDALLGAVKELERRLGRIPGPRFGPRCIDIDILIHGDTVLDEPHLQIPHPRMAERAFVLVPAAHIAADWRDPTSDSTVAEMLAALGETDTGLAPWTDDSLPQAACG